MWHDAARSGADGRADRRQPARGAGRWARARRDGAGGAVGAVAHPGRGDGGGTRRPPHGAGTDAAHDGPAESTHGEDARRAREGAMTVWLEDYVMLVAAALLLAAAGLEWMR